VNTILVLPSTWWFGSTYWVNGASQSTPQTHPVKKGDVLRLHLHELKYSAELRAKPPRIRLLETPRHGRLCLCEILDPWPNAPSHWPERLPPGVSSNPGDVAAFASHC
jgi:hypothetical protein